MCPATNITGGIMRLLPDYVGWGVVILFFVLLLMLTTFLAILWLVFYRG